MKIILCLSLILLGVNSMFCHRRMKKKIKQRILDKVIANHIMTTDALGRLLVESKIDPTEYFNTIEQATNNSVDVILEACGDAYIDKLYDKLRVFESYKEESK